MTFLALASLLGLVAAAVIATRKDAVAKSAAAAAATLESELAESRAAEAQLTEMKLEMRGRDEQLAAERRIAGERDAELGRLREEHKQDRTVVTNQSDEIKRLKEIVERFYSKQEELARSTLGAAESNQRIEIDLARLDPADRQPPGPRRLRRAALRKSTRLARHGGGTSTSSCKQVTEEVNGRQRIDFVVSLGDSLVAIDSKLANDPA